MKSNLAKEPQTSHHFKVIKNNSKKKETSSKIFINTLIPKFEYTNSNGELTSPKNKVFF